MQSKSLISSPTYNASFGLAFNSQKMLWSFSNLIKVFADMKNKNPDGSIVIISHQERILNIADEIVVINGGRIERAGNREVILPSLTGGAGLVGDCPKNA